MDDFVFDTVHPRWCEACGRKILRLAWCSVCRYLLCFACFDSDEHQAYCGKVLAESVCHQEPYVDEVEG
jgi:hypothetical protein